MKSLLCTAIGALSLLSTQSYAQVGVDRVDEAEAGNAPRVIKDREKPGHTSLRAPFLFLVIDSVEKSALAIKLEHIVSVSTHVYMLEGKTPIQELVIDTLGNNSIRIYSRYVSSTNTNLEGMISDLRSRLSTRVGVQTNVGKSYPDGTHAHTIEYNLGNPGQLEYLLQVITEAWVKNKGVQIKLFSS